MLLTEKSIAAVIYLKNNLDTISATMPVWTLAAGRYAEGVELFFVDDGSEDGTEEFFNSFLSTYSSLGLKITYIRLDGVGMASAFNSTKDLIMAHNVLFVKGNTYPNGLLFTEYDEELGLNRVVNGVRRYIKQPFNYSTVAIETMEHYQGFLDVHAVKDPWRVLIGNNSVWSRDLLDAVGWLNEQLNDEQCLTELAMIAKIQAGATFASLERASVFVCGQTIQDAPAPLTGNLKLLLGRYEQGNFNRQPRKARTKTTD